MIPCDSMEGIDSMCVHATQIIPSSIGQDDNRACNDESGRDMLPEQLEVSRDQRVLRGFSLDDLDLDSLHAYRKVFASIHLGHPWAALDPREFLHAAGCWRKNREPCAAGRAIVATLLSSSSSGTSAFANAPVPGCQGSARLGSPSGTRSPSAILLSPTTRRSFGSSRSVNLVPQAEELSHLWMG